MGAAPRPFDAHAQSWPAQAGAHTLSMARTNALLPTLAAPTTYTSRPLRSAHTLDVAALTPTCKWDTNQVLLGSGFQEQNSLRHSPPPSPEP